MQHRGLESSGGTKRQYRHIDTQTQSCGSFFFTSPGWSFPQSHPIFLLLLCLTSSSDIKRREEWTPFSHRHSFPCSKTIRLSRGCHTTLDKHGSSDLYHFVPEHKCEGVQGDRVPLQTSVRAPSGDETRHRVPVPIQALCRSLIGTCRKNKSKKKNSAKKIIHGQSVAVPPVVGCLGKPGVYGFVFNLLPLLFPLFFSACSPVSKDLGQSLRGHNYPSAPLPSKSMRSLFRSSRT